MLLFLLWLAAIGQTLFVAMWASMPWWRQWIGRALMTKSAALGVVLWFIIASAYLGDYEVRDELRIVLFGLVTAGVWFQVWALWHEARSSRNPMDGR